MKKLIALICFIGFNYSINADILPSGQKAIEYCVKIQNVDSFPGVAFVMVINEFRKTIIEFTELNSKDCLNKGYQYNGSEIYAINKAYLNQNGINKIDYSKDNNVLMTNISVPAVSFQYVPDDSPVKNIEEFYRILGFNNTSTIIYLYKRVTTYNDDHQDSVIFSAPSDFDDLRDTISIVTGVKNNTKSSQLLIYPTPSQEYLNFFMINSRSGNVTVELFDMAGHKLSVFSFIKNQEELKRTIDIRNLRSGIYNLRYSLGSYFENRLFLKK